MRPVYESDADRDRQTLVKVKVERIIKQVLMPLPPRHHFDYAATTAGAVTELIEVKCRNIPHQQHDTFMLCTSKFTAAGWYTLINPDIKVSLWVQWTDALGYLDMTVPYPDWRMGGRTDRGDDQDIGLVTHIPISAFTLYDCVNPE